MRRSGPQVGGGGGIEGRDKKSWINSRIESIVHEEELMDLEMQGQTNYTTNKISKRDNTDQLCVLLRETEMKGRELCL